MESMDGNGGSQVVVTELCRVIELVRQLEVHLGESPDLCKDLASQIISLTERSIGLVASPSLALSCSAMPSTVSDIGDVPFKVTRKRNMIQQRKHQVRVRSAGDGESPADDGHSWRKCGQKGILGAKHPRSYYRCKHRHSQGCAATKQVQRTDDDPTLFDVTYHGTHTCVHQAAAAPAAGHGAGAGAGAGAVQLPELIPDAHNDLESLTMWTEEPAVPVEPHGWSAATPFGFSSTPVSGGPWAPAQRSMIWAPVTPEDWGMSATTTDSSHVVPFRAAAEGAGWPAQSELQEVVSAQAVASVPVDDAVDIVADEVLDIDLSSFFD